MVNAPCLPGDLWTPVDFRFRRAEAIFRARRPYRRSDDRAVQQTVKFLRQLSTCIAGAEFCKLRRDMPDLYGAFFVHEEASLSFRSTLEARLLAGETKDAIARNMAITAGAVQAYRETFFDLKGRRDSVDFVVHRVIGRLPEGAAEEEVDAYVKKFIGYFFGARHLNSILYPQGCEADSMNREEVLLAMTSDLQRYKAVMLMHRLRTSDHASRQDLLRGIPGNGKAQGQADESHSSIEKCVNAMLQELPWTMGRSGKALTPQPLRDLDDFAAELDPQEIMLLMTGELSEETLDEVRNLKMPSPGKVRATPESAQESGQRSPSDPKSEG